MRFCTRRCKTEKRLKELIANLNLISAALAAIGTISITAFYTQMKLPFLPAINLYPQASLFSSFIILFPLYIAHDLEMHLLFEMPKKKRKTRNS